MTPEQRRKLTDYAAQKDRRAEPVFAGRNKFFDVVKDNVHMVKTDNNSTGSTVCITGPAGVGKSAFVRELVKRKKLGKHTVHCVEIDRSSLYHPGCVLATVANAVDGFRFDEGLKDRLTGFGIGASAAGTGARFSLSWNPKAPPPFTIFPEELFLSGGKTLLDKGDAFVLVIDEAQAIKPSPGGEANDLLSNLHHKGVNLPIVPVLVGQPVTQERIQETISASRYSYGNEPFMVGLNKNDEKEYMEKMFNWLELKGTARQKTRLSNWIAKECRGWPHHLSNAMKAVTEGLLESNSLALSDLNGKEIENSLTDRRLSYYESRLGSQKEIRFAQKAVLEVLKNQKTENLYENAAQALDSNPPREPVLPSELKDALLMSGLMARRKKKGKRKEYICPISSMAQYLETGRFKSASEFPNLDHSIGY